MTLTKKIKTAFQILSEILFQEEIAFIGRNNINHKIH